MTNQITYVAINGETSEIRARGRDFDNHADAYIAALTDGEGTLERDHDGYMRAVENGKQIYTNGMTCIVAECSESRPDMTIPASQIQEQNS